MGDRLVTSSQQAEARVMVPLPDGVEVSNQRDQYEGGRNGVLIYAKGETQEECRQAVVDFVDSLSAAVHA
jgi:hypothetical protein